MSTASTKSTAPPRNGNGARSGAAALGQHHPDRNPVAATAPLPITIGAGNAVLMSGLSFAKCLKIAEAHSVPIYRVGTRKRVIDARALLAAIERASAETPAGSERTYESMLAELGCTERAS